MVVKRTTCWPKCCLQTNGCTHLNNVLNIIEIENVIANSELQQFDPEKFEIRTLEKIEIWQRHKHTNNDKNLRRNKTLETTMIVICKIVSVDKNDFRVQIQIGWPLKTEWSLIKL